MNKHNIINKSFKENELKELIFKLKLFDLERKNYISIEKFIYHLQQQGFNIATHNIYTYDSFGDAATEIIYRVT